MKEDVLLNRLRIVLAEQNKNNKWLSEQMGMSHVTISRWVNNRLQPSLEQLMKIAEVLDVDVRTLINSNKKQ